MSVALYYDSKYINEKRSIICEMDIAQIQTLGLNKNEAKVYLALLQKKQAYAAELVRSVGVHRNIIYDNLEKLIEKGLVSTIVDGTKRVFVAQDASAVGDYLDAKNAAVEKETQTAKKLLPQITALLGTHSQQQNVTVFRGVKGIKKVCNMLLDSKEFWVIGVSNASVRVLGETYWRNFNIKCKDAKIYQHLLYNADFKDTVSLKSTKLNLLRKLPQELIQVTEIMCYKNTAILAVYSGEPIAVVIEDKQVFESFRKQFEFLWKLSK